MKNSTKQVKNSNAAVDIFVMAINPQITPTHINMGIKVALKSSILSCFLDNMAARCVMSANCAKSDG